MGNFVSLCVNIKHCVVYGFIQRSVIGKPRIRFSILLPIVYMHDKLKYAETIVFFVLSFNFLLYVGFENVCLFLAIHL